MLKGLNKNQRIVKRIFDLLFALIGFVFLAVPILILIIFATWSTGKFGWFGQQRIGRFGKPFTIFKIRTMTEDPDNEQFITLKDDPRITSFGKFLRKYKLDELPQLFNVLIGDMSLVGPRPDVAGYADKLSGNDRIILSVKPGITGPATLKFRDEEEVLSKQKNPKAFNDNVIWPEKVRINIRYIQNWSLWNDIIIIFKTIFK